MIPNFESLFLNPI